MRVLHFILVFILMNGTVGCHPTVLHPNKKPLQQYQFEKLDSLLQVEKRPIAIFIHTKWCKFCNNMKHTTLRNPLVIQTLNKKYYYVSLDGESPQDITLNGHVFHFQATGRHTGIHELAQALGTINGKVSYPTFVLLNSDYEIIFQYSSYLTTSEMSQILN